MSDLGSPEISVIVITPDNYSVIRETMRCLKAQTVKDKLEVIIVTPSKDKLGIDMAIADDFFSLNVVENDVSSSTAAARVAAIKQANAPIIALAEDHCYPDPGWAEAFIKAHSKGYSVVGPTIGNANPGSILSWANLVIEYIPWLEPVQGGIVCHLPGHNSSYKKDILLGYGPDLTGMLKAESILHWDLLRKGHKLYLEPSARACHLNFSKLMPSIRLRFNCARLFADSRRKGWSLFKRIVYIAGSPLIPVVRLYRIIKELSRPGRKLEIFPRMIPALIFLLYIAAFGEMWGYAFGSGSAIEILSKLEFEHYPKVLKEKNEEKYNQ